MKRISPSFYTLIFIILSLSFFLTACGKKNIIVKIDNTKLTLDDFLYDIYLVELERDTWNRNYKDSLGIDYWDYELEGLPMDQLAKDTIMTRVIMYEVLSDQAKKKGIALSDKELSSIEADVDKLISSMSDSELNETGLNRDILLKTFHRLTLSDKYYQTIISGFEINEEEIRNSIDPDEYKEYRTECLYVTTALVSYQKITPLSEDELKEAYDKIVKIKELVQNGSDFDEILEQIDGVQYYERNFIAEDNTAEEEYKEAASFLNNGDYSDIVTTKFGYYIIHMLDNNSAKRYEKAIENAILERKTSQFKIVYDEILKDYDISINNKYWSSLDIGSITIKGD